LHSVGSLAEWLAWWTEVQKARVAVAVVIFCSGQVLHDSIYFNLHGQ